MSFSIIAIKTGSKPEEKFIDPEHKLIKWDHLKILAENTLYRLNNSYTFDNDDFDVISYKRSSDVNIFSIETKKKTIPVSIQAIVGANGSGKSSLIELIYWANYNIGAKLNLFDKKYPVNNKLDFQLFYRTTKSTYYLLKFENGEITNQHYILDSGSIKLSGGSLGLSKKNDLNNFFYSVIINYSLYSLNEMEVGSWVHPLFHKNDAYQTPLVLNPKREEKTGINIETERKLVSRRLQALSLEPVNEKELKNSLRDFGNNKIAQTFELNFIPEYNMGPYHNLEESKGEVIKTLIKQIKEVFSIESDIVIDDNPFNEVCLNYILGKLVKIGIKYPDIYGKYVSNKKLKKETGTFIKGYLKDIKRSSSHIAYKVKGAILYLKYTNEIFGSPITELGKILKINISTLSNLVEKLKAEESFYVNSFMMSPPSYFRTDIRLNDNTTIDSLSSGERQRIHGVSSILYHIVNLNSVEQQKALRGNGPIVSYEYINLILDEIELYYHPDWQRLYVNDLIRGLEKLDPDKLNKIKALNVTFLTHSPFILSDIPSNNVLRLKTGEPVPNISVSNTFAANIHNLLNNDFFLEDGFIGEFAKSKIEEVVDFLRTEKWEYEEKRINAKIDFVTSKDKKNDLNIQLDIIKLQKKRVKRLNKSLNPEKCQEIIDLVGEPVLKESLDQLLKEVKDLKSDKQ